MKLCLFCKKELVGEERGGIVRRKKFCDSDCCAKYKHAQYIEKWKSGKVSGNRGIKTRQVSNYIRTYLLEKFNNSCQLCGWNTINKFTGKSPLTIHHIDGNCLNSFEENLQLLCPNCHSLTETFGNANNNSKRVWRKNSC